MQHSTQEKKLIDGFPIVSVLKVGDRVRNQYGLEGVVTLGHPGDGVPFMIKGDNGMLYNFIDEYGYAMYNSHVWMAVL